MAGWDFKKDAFHNIKKIEIVGAICGIASFLTSLLRNQDSQYITIARESTLVLCLLIFAWAMDKGKIKEVKDRLLQEKEFEIEKKESLNTISSQSIELQWWAHNFKELNDSFYDFAIWNHDVAHSLRDSLCTLFAIYSSYYEHISEYKKHNIEELEIPQEDSNLEELAKEFLDGLFEGRISLASDEAKGITDSFGGWMDNHAKNVEDKSETSILNLRKEVKAVVSGCTRSIIECLKKTLDTRLEQSFPGENLSVSVALKAFINPTQKKQVSYDELYVLTFLRDLTTEQKRDRKSCVGKFWSIRGNTAFRRCLEGENQREWSFISNKLKTLYDSDNYHNERHEFWRFYKSCIVVPLQDGGLGPGENNDVLLYGFLAVDTANEDEKEIFNKKEHLNLVAMAADAISVLLHNVDSHFPDLFQEEDFR